MSGSGNTSQPEVIVQLSDSVYELQPPDGEPQVEIICFHGLLRTDDYSEAFLTAWNSREGKVVWTKDWLGPRLPNARILSISYDSCARSLDGQSDTFIIAENLVKDLIWPWEGKIPVGQRCPVVLVGHSLGGILIKALFLACYRMKGEESGERLKQVTNFQNNCKGVFYYSTPHGGSRITDVISRIPISQNEPFKPLRLLETLTGRINSSLNMRTQNELLIKLFRLLDTQTARISDSFSMRRKDLYVKTQSIAEGLATNYKGITLMVVPEASARQDVDNYYTVQVDHFDVCRPKDVNDPIISKLCEFIREIVDHYVMEENIKHRALLAEATRRQIQ